MTAASLLAAIALLLALPSAAHAQARRTTCTRIDLTGEVNAGQEWKAAIGEGWVFRLVPIHGNNLSGWDLVVDRATPAGYPDALLLATPPYNSISEREVGTTFGLRAQDALGWNPRSFHFLVDPVAFRQGQALYAALPSVSGTARRDGAAAQPAQQIAQKLMVLADHAAAGQFRMLDARISPGTADAAPYAENWSLQSMKTPHRVDPAASGRATPHGEFHWIRFSIALWLPAGWKSPAEAPSHLSPCER